MAAGFAALGLSACTGTDSPEVLMRRAEAAYAKGDDKAAIIDVKSALQQNGALMPARALLARLHNRAFDAAAAEKEIGKAVALGLDPKQALPVLCRALLLQNKFQQLLAISVDADTPEVLSMRGAAFAALRQPAAAEQSYRQALRGESDQIAALTGLGQLAMRAGDAAAAQRYAARLIAAHPQAADAWMFKGDLAYALRRQDEALAAYGRVLALAPGRTSAHVLKGYLLVAKGDLKGAAAAMQAAGKTAPGSLVALYGQAMLDYNGGRYQSALDQLQAILSRSPDHMPSVLLSGAVQLALGSLPQAEKDLLRYLESAPDNAYARQLLATCLLNQGRPQEAVTQLQPLLADTHDAALLTLAGKAAMAAADFAAATSLFERASRAAPASAPLHTALGASRLAQGQEEQALADMAAGAALEHGPTATARLALAATALQLGRHEQALGALADLERDTQRDPAPAYLRGAVYTAMHAPVPARAAYEHALALRPGYFLALQALVAQDVGQGDVQSAQQRLAAVVKAEPRNVAALTLLAELARVQQNQAGALAWMRQAAAVDPAAAAPTLGLARELLANGNPDAALTLLRKALPAHPDDPELLDVLGLAQLAAGDTGGALETYGRLTALAPRNPLAFTRLAAVYAKRGDPAAAERQLNRAVALQPAYLPAQLALSLVYMRQGQHAKALAVARQLQRQPRNAAAGFSMEGDLRSAADVRGALAAYEKAFALQPTTALLIRQHILLSQDGRAAVAAERMAGWQHGHPDDIEAAGYMGEAAIHARQYAAAVEQLQQVLRRRPDDAAALNNLAYAYQQLGDPLAKATAEHAYRVAPASVAVMDTLAWILLDDNDHGRALPLLRQVVAQQPAAPAYRYHLATALLQAGDRAGARREVDRLLDSKQQFAQLDQVLLLRKRLDSGPGAG